jgi:hypothetical protein
VVLDLLRESVGQAGKGADIRIVRFWRSPALNPTGIGDSASVA